MQSLEPSPKIDGEFVLVAGVPSPPRPIGDLEDARWSLALRIAASGCLGRSRLMVDFLLYIVDRHIRNLAEEITEQQIGVLVFGRSEGYDSNEDNIVRSYARTLRRRLDEYFAGKGREEELRLEIPRGGYIPLFTVQPSEEMLGSGFLVQESPQDRDSEDSTHGQAATPSHHLGLGYLGAVSTLRRYSALLTLLIGITAGLAIAGLVHRAGLHGLETAPTEGLSSLLWEQMFAHNKDTFVVPSDDGLIIMQGMTERPVPLASYVNGNYRTALQSDGSPYAARILNLGARRYTSVVDLNFVAHLAQLKEVEPDRMKIRYARDMRIDDLRTSNAVLIGSIEANPWMELFEPQMHFRFSIHSDPNLVSGIVNPNPGPGEKAVYGASGADHTYGVVAYLSNLGSNGHVLIIAGLNTAGTEAATTLLLNQRLMAPILERARSSDGGLRPFELLIEADNVAANASTPRVVIERIAP